MVLVNVVFDNHAFVRLAEATHIPGEHHKVAIRTIHGFKLKQPTAAEGSSEFLRDEIDSETTLPERTGTNTARFKGLRNKDGDGEPRLVKAAVAMPTSRAASAASIMGSDRWPLPPQQHACWVRQGQAGEVERLQRILLLEDAAGRDLRLELRRAGHQALPKSFPVDRLCGHVDKGAGLPSSKPGASTLRRAPSRSATAARLRRAIRSCRRARGGFRGTRRTHTWPMPGVPAGRASDQAATEARLEVLDHRVLSTSYQGRARSG
jgi:hypothetical protein